MRPRIPNERVERGDQCAGVDGSRNSRPRVQVDLLLPALDARGQETPGLDQFGDEPLRDRHGATALGGLWMRPSRPWRKSIAPRVEMEIAGYVAERPDAAGLRREADQLLHGLLARRRRRIERGLGMTRGAMS